MSKLLALAKDGVSHLEEVIVAKEAGIEPAPSSLAHQLEVEMGRADRKLSASEAAALWAQIGAFLRDSDPETYRLILGISTAIASLHGLQVTN